MIKKIILSLSLVSTIFVSACSPNNDGNKDNTDETVESEVLLNSFENYYDCYDFYYSGRFEIDFLKDAELVTDGETLVQLTSDASLADTMTNMSIGVPLSEIESEENNYRDFSKISYITYDVCNTSENEVIVSTSIMQKKIGVMYTNVQTKTLEAGEKATIKYDVNRYEIFYSLGIAGPTHVNVTFTGTNSLVCIDNMRLHYTQDSFIEPEATIDTNEIIGFEKAYQAFTTYTTGTTLKAEVMADMAMASNGNCYVCIRRDGVEDGEVLSSGGKFGISANYLGNINFDSYPTTAYIAFDYKSSWTGATLWVVPRLVSTASGLYANIQNARLDCDEKWHTFYIPMSFIPRSFDNIEIDFSGKSYGDLYLDNFRIESSVPDGTPIRYIADSFNR